MLLRKSATVASYGHHGEGTDKRASLPCGPSSRCRAAGSAPERGMTGAEGGVSCREQPTLMRWSSGISVSRPGAGNSAARPTASAIRGTRLRASVREMGANQVTGARGMMLESGIVMRVQPTVARSVTAAALMIAACGNREHADGTSNGAGGASHSGAAALAGGGTSLGGSGAGGGAGGTSAGGTSAGSGAGGTSAGSGGGGTSGAADGGGGVRAAAGDAGTGGSPEAGTSSVLDPDLPTPSRDCRAADSGDCLSVAGIYEGKSVDEAFDTRTCGSGGVKSGKWAIGCDHVTSTGRVVLDVPITRPGEFNLALTPANATSLDFQYLPATATGVVTLFAGNFVRAEVEGTVVVTSASSAYRVVSGTFHGVWSTPDGSCKSLAGAACASAELNVTFRLSTRYGSCFDDSECTPPLTCDMIGFACFNK